MKINQKIAGLALIASLLAKTGHAQTNESVVNWEADVAGLSLLSAGDVPKSGTFWLVTPPAGGKGGMLPPYPCLPSGFEGGNIYTLPGGAFLVDATGGNDGTDSLQLAAQMLSVSNLIQQAETVATSRAMGMRAMDLSGPPVPGGGSGTNVYLPSGESNPVPDYGTNLWISQWNLTNKGVTGIASNTLADISYELMTNSDLTTTNWGHSGQFILGSEATNWTALNPFAVSPTNHLFFRLLSYVSSDGSGLPDWWEWEYFGGTGIDPYGDPMGDGYSNLYKYQHGLNPNVFYQPAAPQGLTATYNASNGTADISWLPSPGNVTGYTLTTPGGATIPLSASITSYADIDSDIAANLNGIFDPSQAEYTLVADYAPGPSASASVLLLTNQPSVWLVQGAQGSNFLAVSVSALPSGTAAIRFIRQDRVAELIYNDFSFDASNDIPLTAFTNGLFYLPPALTFAAADGYNVDFVNYHWYAVTINSNATPTSQRVNLGQVVGAANTPLTPLYLDGRVQLKQNLKFLLRAAATDASFGYYTDPAGNYVDIPRTFPTNYAEASFYRNAPDLTAPGSGYYFSPYVINFNPPPLDIMQPFKDNYLYENCVFDTSRLKNGGQLTTGVMPEGSGIYWPEGYMVFSNTLAYSFTAPTVGGTAIPALGQDQATWLMTGGNTWFGGYQYEIGFDVIDYAPTNVMLNAKNVFGLPFLSIELAADNGSGGTQTQTIYPGGISPQTQWLYPQTAQPDLQTVEYDFWNYNYGYYDGNGNWNPIDVLPEESGFSPTNQSDNCLIAPLGGTLQVAGYAKMAVTNGYPGIYGYVGQYFANAYQIDTNGVVTTNTTGILSPYGAFFPTEPGPVALMTMPDPDTGQQGTGTVYAVSLAFDKNRDGIMDLSLFGADATSQNSPFVFWCNNNFDRLHLVDGANYVQDDVLQGEDGPYNFDPNDADCNYKIAGNRQIPCTRDLEDFARLWICGITPTLASNLPAGSTITLNWGDVGNPNSGNPTIDFFKAYDGDGGIEYLTNETSAAGQINPDLNLYLGRLGPGQSLQLNAYQIANNGLNHLIWCGVTNGSGQLNLTIADANGNVLAQTSAYLQIVDIKQMYERWTVGDNGYVAPTNTAYLAQDNLPGNDQPFQYTSPAPAGTPYILYVHGWNMATWDKSRFAETAFKRLYWQGYQGRFGLFSWPTYYDFPAGEISYQAYNPQNYDNSEFNAWRSAQGLLNKLNDLNAQYPGQVYLLAHSMGNVVAGEALRLAGNNQVVNTYVASQGAVPAHCYDPSTPNSYTFLEPDCYAAYWTNGAPSYFNGTAGAGVYVNFYNTNDYALNAWIGDQHLKPDIGYGFNIASNSFYKGIFDTDPLNFPTDTYQIFAYADPAWSLALGAQPNVGGAFSSGSQTDLQTVWTTDFLYPTASAKYSEHFWHSAEFRGDYPSEVNYWDTLLGLEGFHLK